ncbi:hypothetical protein CGRA01v4_06789 [Colletotrichum graminicola]|nr:hypothetical protein CGRA01v4_06789 [Colletotrichum graminicola]
MHPSQSCTRLEGLPCSLPGASRTTHQSRGFSSCCGHSALLHRVYIVGCVTDDDRIMVPAGSSVAVNLYCDPILKSQTRGCYFANNLWEVAFFLIRPSSTHVRRMCKLPRFLAGTAHSLLRLAHFIALLSATSCS